MEQLVSVLIVPRAPKLGSSLAAELWVYERPGHPGLLELEVLQPCRAMGFLLEADEAVQRRVFWTVRNHLTLEVAVMFTDPAATYNVIDGEESGEEPNGYGSATAGDDQVDAVGEPERRSSPKRSRRSKDRRLGLAQVVIGFAVTRDGIPIRCWAWPRKAFDARAISEVTWDFNEGKLGRVADAADSGRYDSRGEPARPAASGQAPDLWSAIIGEKKRLGKPGFPWRRTVRHGPNAVPLSGWRWDGLWLAWAARVRLA